MVKKYFYITLFIVSIVGLSLVQFQYFRIGLNLAGHQFNENMGEAIDQIKEGLGNRNELTYLIETSITGEEGNFKLSLDSVRDASSFFLKDYVSAALSEQGITAAFAYDLHSRDSLVYLSSDVQFEEGENLLTYPIALGGYLPDRVGKPLVLEIRFENINRYLLSQLNGLTIPSIIFIVVIVAVLIWVFRAFYLQRSLITSTNEFINNLTHELKTPVFSMGLATKILEEKSNGDQKELLGMMRTQVDKLKSQIDKVLELAIIEGKKGVLNKKEFDFRPVLERLASDFGKMVELEGGSFESRLKGEAYPILGDEYHLENAVNSLLENARKYSGEHIKVLLLAEKRGRNLVLQVSDEGIGMPNDVQGRIFEKYYRGPSGDLHEVKGYGLGLHYVKRIIRMHGGKIGVESREGEGSSFTVTLPLLK